MAQIALIGSAGVPGRYGGFETLAEELVSRLGHSLPMTVYCSAHNYPKAERPKRWKGARLVYIPLPANGPLSILYDMLSMLHALWYARVFCVLGVGGAFFFPLLKLVPGRRLVVHLDGLEWQRNKWNKPTRRFLKLCEQIAVRFADELIADNAALQQYLQETYGVESTLIAYGGDQARQVAITPEYARRYSFLGLPYAFKVCRIVPENNVEIILQAFAAVPERVLVFVGDWQGNAFAQNLFVRYHKLPNLFLLDPIYDPDELGVLRSNAFLYVHGHSAGGTNPSLVEAMSLGLPIAAFDVNFNRETTAGLALYFSQAEDLVTIIRDVPVQRLTGMGPALLKVAEKQYRWEDIARAYQKLFSPVEVSAELPAKAANTEVVRFSSESVK